MFKRNDALDIAAKLGAKIIKKGGHDFAQFWHQGKLIGWYGTRRSLKAGHDYIPRQLNISPHQCREFLICNLSLSELIALLKGKGIISEN